MIHTADCLDYLVTMPDDSIDALITDPPAGINFMQKAWDSSRGGREQWVEWMRVRMAECFRVLKPGAHGLIWALPRTSHWTALALEDSGFEIRDRVAHLFGTGFPKGLDLAKAIDKSLGVTPTPDGTNPNHRPKSGVDYEGIYAGGNTGAAVKTKATSPEAKKWEGWGTALKPGGEDWWLVRKPIEEKTIALNVMKWGTGALNIDACRIPTEDKLTRKLGKTTTSDSGWKSTKRSAVAGKDGGRWPANVVLDHNEEDACQKGASKFYYVPKAGKAEKNAGLEAHNPHPTVKSVALMQWLIKLITPPHGVVLDPFAGSGSTGIACKVLNIPFIGIEQSEEYANVARARIENAE